MADIHKAGGILIKDRKILVARAEKKEVFFAPGGKIEAGETVEGALIRELKEEFLITVYKDDLEMFGTFYADAMGHNGKTIQMDVFIVKKWIGDPLPHMEIEEILWINSKVPKTVKIGSIFEHDVIPRLKKSNLID
ncbi:NUDIX domain-containing protein [Candidatus Parcubacteria bacterium]|nr:NUDIX domain-containing protein [Candidatus Parcubacteria bacterium]